MLWVQKRFVVITNLLHLLLHMAVVNGDRAVSVDK